MYMIRVNGMKVRSCRTLKEAKSLAKYYNGKIYRLVKGKLPKATMLRYNDSAYAKKEMYREIYSENNHGYHFIKKRWTHTM